ncbi:Uncharacterised protein [Bacillus freudenreichii]|nr:Uncharacterised protein [Bacillus freudenreichii]
MFPKIINQQGTTFNMLECQLVGKELRELFKKHPYEIYAIVDESIDNDNPMLTTFLVLHSADFQDNVLLYDISREHHTTFTTKLFYLAKGYIEVIDVGIVDRFPVKLYKKEEIT